MKKELAGIDSKPLWQALFLLWPACGLGGGWLPIRRAGYEYTPATPLTERIERGDDEQWHPWDRFDFVRTHRELSGDLILAKKWAAANR
jgi:hypothetical protein